MRGTLVALFVSLQCLVAWGGNNIWTSSGPIGGTFPTFTYHPTKATLVFAGSFDGLYRSTNSGATWTRLDISEGEHFPVSVRFHRNNPDAVFASAERTLFTSTDQGNNWQQVGRLPAEFSDFEFHSSDPAIIYGISFKNGVFRSNDGGRTWAAKNSGLKLNPAASCCDLPQIAVDPRNGGIVYALTAGRIAYRSSNGGDSWSVLNGLHFNDEVRSLVIDPQNPETMYSGNWDGVFKTTNAGATWSDLHCDCGAAGIAIDPKTPLTIYAAGDGLSKSMNGGQSWARLNNSIAFAGVQASPASGSQVVLGGDGGGIYRSLNGGRGLQPVNNRVDAMPIRHLASSPQRPTDIFGQGDFQVFRSRDGGSKWEIWPLGHDFEMTDIQVHPKNPNFVIATGILDGGSMAISNDGGGHWEIAGPDGADGAFAAALDPINESILFIAPLSGDQNLGIARSSDKGSRWQLVNSGITDKSIEDLALDPANSNNVYAASSSGKVFKSNNGGNSWKSSSSGLKGGAVHSLDLDRNNTNILYAATERGLYKTTNAGQTWILKNQGMPRQEFLFVRTDPSNSQVVYCGGEDSIFVSADGGQNWSAFDSNGLGRYLATDLLINPAQPSTIHLGANRGVFTYKKSSVPGGPEIVQLLPSSGRTGSTISIQGKSFGSTQGGSKVFFGSTDAGTAVSWSDSKIEIQVPSSAQTSAVSVQVGSRKSNSLQFVLLASSGAIEPAGGPGAGGTLVTIVSPSQSGSLSFVLFGNSLAKEVRFIPPDTIICKSPPGNGSVDVSVVSATGSTTVGAFSYQ